MMKDKRQLSIHTELMGQLSAIRDGNAAPGVMGYLADVWEEGLGIANKTPKDAFSQHFDKDSDVLYRATKLGFKRCLWRADLPEASQIIRMYKEDKTFRLRSPCLIGMSLTWEDDHPLTSLTALPSKNLSALIAFYLCGHDAMPTWLQIIAEQYPAMVVDTVVKFAQAIHKLGTRELPINAGLYHLIADANIANMTILPLLQTFPLQATKAQYSYLNILLHIALSRSCNGLMSIIRRKLALKSINATQKVYWYAAATLIKPNQYARPLMKYVDKLSVRVNALANFISINFDKILTIYPLPEDIIADFIILFSPYLEAFPQEGINFGYQDMLVQRLIETLKLANTEAAGAALLRLCKLDKLEKLRPMLNQAYKVQHENRK